MKELPREEYVLLEALQRGEENAYKALYLSAYKPVESFIRDNSGTIEDARDCFQEAIIVLIRNINGGGFELKGKLGGYLAAIARKLWLKQLRDRRLPVSGVPVEELNLAYGPGIEAKLSEEKKYQLISEEFENLEEDCRQVIRGRLYRRLSHALIAEEMGYAVDYVRVKLHKCLKYLQKKVKSNPDYRQLQ